MGRKVNKDMKQIEAAARLVSGGKKKAKVIVTAGGTAYSAGLDASAPIPLLVPGIYTAQDLLDATASTTLKYAESVVVGSRQNEHGWNVVLMTPDKETLIDLEWSQCGDVEAATPPTTWPVDKTLLANLRTAYTVGQRLDKHMLRVVRFATSGVVSFMSPLAVAQWFDPHGTTEHAFEVGTADVKRALTYRGGKLASVGASDGKVNFVFDDGAFLRVEEHDSTSYDDSQISTVFDFSRDEECHKWPVRAGEKGEKLLSSIFEAKDTMVYLDKLPQVIKLPHGVVNQKIFAPLAESLTHIQPSGPLAHFENVRIGLYGNGYRAVVSAALSPADAEARGLTGEDGDE